MQIDRIICFYLMFWLVFFCINAHCLYEYFMKTCTCACVRLRFLCIYICVCVSAIAIDWQMNIWYCPRCDIHTKYIYIYWKSEILGQPKEMKIEINKRSIPGRNFLHLRMWNFDMTNQNECEKNYTRKTDVQLILL